jgi:2-oxo-4-hydroxy-4-carboxy-5-ureidoimidazoline decarboxylase
MATMAEFPIDLDEVNAMDRKAFVAAFGDVAERAPWVAADAEADRPFARRDAMTAAFARAIAEGDAEKQTLLLQAHPELAARATLTDESAREQKIAGLNRLTGEERSRLVALNAAYRDRFGFPFIVAVRGANKDDILAALEARLKNPPAAEFARALVEVQRIVRFRIEDRVAP